MSGDGNLLVLKNSDRVCAESKNENSPIVVFSTRPDSPFLFNIILWVGLDLDPEAAPSFGPPAQ